jgi:hypothetical protein
MPNTKAVGVAYADPQFDSLAVTGASTFTGAVIANGGVVASTVEATGSVAAANTVAGLYFLTTAITANSTTTSAPVGSIATTTNATGTGKLFVSDGTKWQAPA